jgi:hypothetical protein
VYKKKHNATTMTSFAGIPPSPLSPLQKKITLQHQQPQVTMAAPHHRKVELQSPADFTYLYANTIALARRKLDLNLPPSAIDNETPDPMRERVRELVDDVGFPLSIL